MGIDRIGRAGGTPITGAVTTPTAPTAATESFAAVAKRVGAPEATSLLDQLKTGQIDMNRFLDLRVEQATAHLQGMVEPGRLDFIRQSLRVQIQSDPALIELVKAATGSSPPSPDRE